MWLVFGLHFASIEIVSFLSVSVCVSRTLGIVCQYCIGADYDQTKRAVDICLMSVDSRMLACDALTCVTVHFFLRHFSVAAGSLPVNVNDDTVSGTEALSLY